MKSLRLLFLLVMLPLVSTGVAAAKTVTYDHRLGSATLSAVPQRVAVLDYGTLDTLDALDALAVPAEIAVPKTNLPPYLSKFKGEAYTDLGGVREFNIEAVAAFKPDLIIISGRQQDQYADLAKIAPVILVETDYENYRTSVFHNLQRLADVFGVRDRIDARLTALDADIAALREKAAVKSEKALVILTNDGRISAYGPGSRFGLIHDVFGVPAADTKIPAGRHGQQINFEYIAKTNPDVIFVIDRSVVVGGKANGLAMLDNKLVNRTAASKNNRIVSLDPGIWYLSGGGLVSIKLMLDEISTALD